MVNCLICDNLEREVSWGPHTTPPHGYCPVKKKYIWEGLDECSQFQTSDETQDPNQKAIK